MIPGVWPLKSCRELEGKSEAQKGKSRWAGAEGLHQQPVLLLMSLCFCSAGPTRGARQGGPRWAAGMSSVRATAATPGDTHLSSEPCRPKHTGVSAHPQVIIALCVHRARWGRLGRQEHVDSQ